VLFPEDCFRDRGVRETFGRVTQEAVLRIVQGGEDFGEVKGGLPVAAAQWGGEEVIHFAPSEREVDQSVTYLWALYGGKSCTGDEEELRG
jgi:hypothetical protein